MNPIEVTCDSDGSMSVGIKQGFHVYTEEENSKILGVIEHLRAENERLRGVEASNIALRATNDRLRELCKKLYDFAWFECPYNMDVNNFAEDMKELGIEVDG